MKIEWYKIEPESWMYKLFQRSRMKYDKMPDAVYESSSRKMLALQYLEDGKWERWGIRNVSENNIVSTWSQIMEWLRPLIGDNHAIEVYPREKETINTAPFRWFWIIPGNLPKEYDLNMPEPIPESYCECVQWVVGSWSDLPPYRICLFGTDNKLSADRRCTGCYGTGKPNPPEEARLEWDKYTRGAKR